ncbi:MAG: protein translocase subunit SecF, partial [Eubacteriales bacterium]|nr:protein translocase subunit SecF [Eubacteriales bacterium]
MDFVKKFKTMACVSAAIILVGIVVGIFAGGLNVGVDFTGGTLFTIDLKGDYDMSVITNALTANGLGDAQAVRTGASASSQTLVDIRMKSKNDDAAESDARVAVLETVQATYPQAEITAVDRVDGVASKDLVRNAFLSILIASALILVYIWIRFELYSGLAAVLALIHDVVIMLAFTCILRIPVNSPFIAAVLTIVGYSINNTIVVFDRIRENSKSDAAVDKHRVEIVNKSISQTMTRSINTSITTLATIVMLYVLGVESIRQFALPIIIGLLAGTYSSIFLAGPMWATWYVRRADKMR